MMPHPALATAKKMIENIRGSHVLGGHLADCVRANMREGSQAAFAIFELMKKLDDGEEPTEIEWLGAALTISASRELFQ